MEQPAAIALPGAEGAAGLVLAGLFTSSPEGEEAAGAVIAPPHPMMGGSMEVPVVSEIAHACASAGLSSLRFDWRGVGGSAGTPSGDPDQACVDYGAALDFLEDSVAGPIVGCGYSFGAATAVRVCVERPRVRRLLLVAPPPSMIAEGSLAAFSGSVLVAIGDNDEYAPIEEVKSMLVGCERAQIVVLPGVDHFFMAGLSDLGRHAAAWL